MEKHYVCDSPPLLLSGAILLYFTPFGMRFWLGTLQGACI